MRFASPLLIFFYFYFCVALGLTGGAAVNFATLTGLVEWEVANNIPRAGNGSGSRTLLRLLRALDFIVVRRGFAGPGDPVRGLVLNSPHCRSNSLSRWSRTRRRRRRSAPSAPTSTGRGVCRGLAASLLPHRRRRDTMSPHHPWLVRSAVGVALYTLPGRAHIFAGLCGTAPDASALVKYVWMCVNVCVSRLRCSPAAGTCAGCSRRCMPARWRPTNGTSSTTCRSQLASKF